MAISSLLSLFRWFCLVADAADADAAGAEQEVRDDDFSSGDWVVGRVVVVV